MQTRPRARLSLRGLSLLSTVSFGLLVLVLAGGLLTTSRQIWRAAQAGERGTEAIVLVNQLDLTLREYERLGDLPTAGSDPAMAAIRSELEGRLRRLLVALEPHLGSAAERRRLATLSRLVETYLAEREALETRKLPPAEVIRGSRPSLERALESSLALRAQSENDLREAQHEAARLLRLQSLWSASSAVVLLCGLVAVTLGMRSLVLRPVLDLQDGIRRFRSGEDDVNVRAGRASEMRELANAFNEMAATIMQRRRDQQTFLAGVAHDLLNPLSALRLTVDLVQRKPDTAAHHLPVLGRHIDRLTRMVRDLLDIASVEAGQLKLKLEEFDLRDGARAIVDLYGPTTSSHPIRLDLPDRPVLVRGDSLRIEQAISNLVSNAIKYSPGGGPIDVHVAASTGTAEVTVTDRGLGIPADEIPELFLPFRRRLGSVEGIPGSGLGLAIVQRIVHAHGGHIDVESQPGVGSTFRVRLPSLDH